jgi:hypothetical protein
MSDDGPGNPEDSIDGEIDKSARLRNLFAARTPRQQPYGDTISPVNVLNVLFNTYLDTDLELTRDSSYSSTMFGTDEMFRHLMPVSEADLH